MRGLNKKFNDMKQRCFNTKCPSYHDYGARGITICSEWLDNPSEFISYVETHLGTCPDGYSLDRIDNNGNYEPGNIRWASITEQNRNKRQPDTHNRKVGQTGYKWVSKCPTGYIGLYRCKGQKYYVGHYDCPLKAYNSVVSHRLEHGFSVPDIVTHL